MSDESTPDTDCQVSGSDTECSWREIIKDRYLRAEKLLEESVKDPVTFPYKSKYAARELLRELAELLRQKSQSLEGASIGSISEEELNVMLAGVLVMIANVDIEVEEPASAELNLRDALALIDDDPTNPLNITISMSALNQLGLLWSMRGENEKGLDHLKRAEKLYNTFSGGSVEPCDVKSLFTTANENNGRSQLEKLFTHTLYYLAQVFKSLGMDERSALYCHSTLERQVERDHNFGRIEWAVNAATLSQYLAEKYAFKEARHHLAAAQHFMRIEEKALSEISQESEEFVTLKENWDRRNSDVARCWVKYCLLLLCTSRERLMGTSNEDHGDPPPVPPKDLVGLSFPTLDLKDEEKLVTADYVLVYDDAKQVFLFGQKCCNVALEYNTLDGHVTDHVNICEDLSGLYRLLAFYEENDDSQCKMHKRRLDLLSKVVVSLNPQYYLDLCRSLWMELGTICLAMAEIKLMKINATKNPESKAVMKCNSILRDGVDYIEKYIHSYDDKQKQGPPDRYPENVEKDIISAHLLVANMYMKFPTADRVKHLYYNSKSLDVYKAVVSYCKRNKEFKDMEDELRLAEEMTLLLPAKIARINDQISRE
uniref:KIF-binding protein n=2 Tax=Lygus hesperus TaxID=30085 RepID=A0A0A9W887_LYGHE